jgi:arylsulfatase A-like enzyme
MTRLPRATLERVRGARAGCAVALACALAAVACTRPARPPNVLVVVADTLRADRLGAYGSPRGLTPFLDALAARGVVFENAYATSSWTSPSVASLFTSRYPLQHGVVDFGSVLAGSETTLAERLRSLGFATGGFSANFRLSAQLGYGQGFDVWHAFLEDPDAPDPGPKVPARFVREQALAWLGRVWRADAPRPVFLYLQLMEPHSPYDPPEALRRQVAPEATRAQADAANALLTGLRFDELTDEQVGLLASLYDGVVAVLDAELRELFAALEQRGFLEHAIVVVTSDHGEEFREHGRLMHGLSLFESGVRVPLLMSGAGIESGVRVAQPVSLLDVAPTLLALLGVGPPEGLEGRSLAAALRGEAGAPAGRDLLLELAPKAGVPEVRAHGQGLVRGTRKLLVDPQGQLHLYDLAQDPLEQGAAAPPAETQELAAALARLRRELGARAGAPAPTLPLDERTREDLRALGYLPEPDPAPRSPAAHP